jgi:hypothetical protein
MSRNRGIEVFDACSSPLEDGFESTKCVMASLPFMRADTALVSRM